MSYLENLVKGAAESYQGASNSFFNMLGNAANSIKQAVTYKEPTTTTQSTETPVYEQSLPTLISTAVKQINTTKINKPLEAPDNSALGILKNTFAPSSLFKAATQTIPNIAKAFYENQVNPSPEQKTYESQFLPYAPESSPVTRMTTAPGMFAARQITRFINPGLQPVATDLAQIHEVNRPGGFADQVANGTLPVPFLNDLAVLHKTAPQVVGDVAQAVMTAYAGGQAEGALSRSGNLGLRQSINEGMVGGLKVGTAFGTAQAASSGSTDPMEILGTIGTSAAGGSLIGGIVSGAIPASKEVVTAVKKVANKHAELVAKYGGEGGFVKNPLGEKISDDQQIKKAEDYVKEQVAKREAARVSDKTPGVVSSFFSNLKNKLVDFTTPIEDAVRQAQKDSGMKFTDTQVSPIERVHDQIDMALRAPTLAGKFMEDNGIKDVIQKVDNLDNLDQYLIAKQAIDLNTRGVETGRDLQKDIGLVHTFGKRYEQFAQQIGDYSRALLDKSVKDGLISQELSAKLKETYPNYVPMNRVFNELEKPDSVFGQKGVANLSNQTVVQTLKGSSREVESPFASLLQKTSDVFVQGEKNKAAQVLTDFAATPEGKSMGIKKIGDGVEKGSEDGVISVYRNGVKEEWAAPKAIAEAAKNLNSQQLNILGKILAFPTRLAKVGITGINLPFIGSNVVKDQIDAFINSNKAFKTSVANPSVFIQALTNAVGHGQLYDELVRNGAGGTSFDIARNAATESVEKIRAGKSLPSKIAYIIKNPSELLRLVENIVGRSEEFTRLQQYQGTKQAMLEKGATTEDAIIKARTAARENTVNFARRGEWGQVLNSAFLYLNAGIQGSRLILKNVSERPAATISKIAGALFFPVAAMTTWNIADPKRQEAYKDIQDYEKDGNLIIIPPNPTKDDQGRWNVIKIPLPAGYKALTVPVRKAIESSYDISKVGFGDIAQSLFGTFSPIGSTKNEVISTVTPQALKPTLQGFTNTNFFTGLPIVPDSKKGLSPENQVQPYTSGTARVIGKAGNWSPIQVEEFIKGTLGGVGSQVLNVSDRALAGLDIIPKDQIGGQNLVDAVLARFDKARGGALDNGTTNKLKELLVKQADDKFRLKQGAELLYTQLNALPKAEANAKAQEIAKTNMPLFNELKSVIDSNNKGLNYNDRLMLQLQVANGERAKFIYENIKSMKTPAEKKAYATELQKKGILTKNVLTQLSELLSQK